MLCHDAATQLPQATQSLATQSRDHGPSLLCSVLLSLPFESRPKPGARLASAAHPAFRETINLVSACLLAQATEEFDRVMTDSGLGPQRGELVDDHTHRFSLIRQSGSVALSGGAAGLVLPGRCILQVGFFQTGKVQSK